MAGAVPNADPIPNEFARRIFIPGIAALLTVWIVQSGITLLNFPTMVGARSGVDRYLFLHWDMKVAFIAAGIVAVIHGGLVGSSPKHRYLAALFPGFFEILKWAWMLYFPLPDGLDPARQVYRFSTLSIGMNINFWVIHIVIPTVLAIGAVAVLNQLLQWRELTGPQTVQP